MEIQPVDIVIPSDWIVVVTFHALFCEKMVLVDLPTKQGDFGQGQMLVNIPYMEHMGCVGRLFLFVNCHWPLCVCLPVKCQALTLTFPDTFHGMLLPRPSRPRFSKKWPNLRACGPIGTTVLSQNHRIPSECCAICAWFQALKRTASEQCPVPCCCWDTIYIHTHIIHYI